MTIPTLLDRLREAEAPSRELDARIHFRERVPCIEKILANEPVYMSVEGVNVAGERCIYGDDVPAFTASVDAAIALAERLHPGRSIMMGWRQTSETRPWARVGLWPDPDATGATPAIALVLATLKALSAQKQGGE